LPSFRVPRRAPMAIGSDAEHRNQDKQNPLVPIMSAAILARVSVPSCKINRADEIDETDPPREIDASHNRVYFTGAKQTK